MSNQNTKYKQFLIERNLQQVDVAKGTGLTTCVISLISGGSQNITQRTLKKLVVFHRCNPGDILDWEKWIADEDKKKQAKSKK